MDVAGQNSQVKNFVCVYTRTFSETISVYMEKQDIKNAAVPTATPLLGGMDTGVPMTIYV